MAKSRKSGNHQNTRRNYSYSYSKSSKGELHTRSAKAEDKFIVRNPTVETRQRLQQDSLTQSRNTYRDSKRQDTTSVFDYYNPKMYANQHYDQFDSNSSNNNPEYDRGEPNTYREASKIETRDSSKDRIDNTSRPLETHNRNSSPRRRETAINSNDGNTNLYRQQKPIRYMPQRHEMSDGSKFLHGMDNVDRRVRSLSNEVRSNPTSKRNNTQASSLKTSTYGTNEYSRNYGSQRIQQRNGVHYTSNNQGNPNKSAIERYNASNASGGLKTRNYKETSKPKDHGNSSPIYASGVRPTSYSSKLGESPVNSDARLKDNRIRTRVNSAPDKNITMVQGTRFTGKINVEKEFGGEKVGQVLTEKEKRIEGVLKNNQDRLQTLTNPLHTKMKQGADKAYSTAELAALRVQSKKMKQIQGNTVKGKDAYYGVHNNKKFGVGTKANAKGKPTIQKKKNKDRILVTQQEKYNGIKKINKKKTFTENLVKNGKYAKTNKVNVKGTLPSQYELSLIKKGKNIGKNKLNTVTSRAFGIASKGIMIGGKFVRGGVRLATAMQDEKSESERFKTLLVDKPVGAVKNKVTSKVTNKATKPIRKTAKKVVKTVAKSLLEAAKATLAALKSILVEAAAAFGSTLLLLIPIVMVFAAIVINLTTFTGDKKSQKSYTNIFNAEQTEFAERADNEYEKLEAKVRTSLGYDGKSRDGFTITKESLEDCETKQWQKDYATRANSSNIDFKAQLATMQILGGGFDVAGPTAMSDVLTILHYWIDQGIVESYDNFTMSNPYQITWKGEKEVTIHAVGEATYWTDDKNGNSTATDAAKKEAEVQLKSQESSAGGKRKKYTSSPKRVATTTPTGNKKTVEIPKRTSNGTIIKDKDGKVVMQTVTYEEKKVTYTIDAKEIREKEFTENETQYVYNLVYENGDKDDYVRSIQEAYRNQIQLKVEDYTLGKKGYNLSGDYTSIGNVSADQASVQKAIWNFCKKKGLGDTQAAAICGNAFQESGYNPSALQGSETSTAYGNAAGLWQWDGGRKTNLFQYAKTNDKKWTDIEIQLNYMWKELNDGYYKGRLTQMQFFTTNDVTLATNAFNCVFEGSADSFNLGSVAAKKRVNEAKKTYEKLKGAGSASSDSSSDSDDKDSTEDKAKIDGRIIWVGDSRTVGMQQAVEGSDKNEWVCKTSEGYSWFVNTAIGSVNSKLNKDDTIIFNLGVNDLGNVDKYVKKLNSLANGDWKKAKKIIVMSVNPTDSSKYSGGATNEAIKKFNSEMKSGLDASIKYVDTYSQIKDTMKTSDGLHYDKATYKLLYNIIRFGSSIGGSDSTGDGAGSQVSVSKDSKHYNKTYYFEQLIRGLATRYNYVGNDNGKEFKLHVAVGEDELQQIDDLYSSDILMEDFKIGSVSFGSGAESNGYDGDIKDAIKEDNLFINSAGAIKQFTTPGNPFSPGQCTWYAWSRFYQVYGYDSGARGNGKTNAAEIVRAHPDKFVESSTPAPGGVISFDGVGPGHVAFIEAVEGDTIWLFDGNYGGNGTLWLHKTTIKKYIADNQAYGSGWNGNYTIAVPKN